MWKKIVPAVTLASTVALCLVVAARPLAAQPRAQVRPPAEAEPSSPSSPFDGQWVADVPLPGGGEPVRFTLLLMTEDDELRGTLQIGTSRAVPIENGKVRGDVISFQRTLGDNESIVRFLARVADDGLHVGFMQRPAEGTGGGSAKVINFVAKRASARVHP